MQAAKLNLFQLWAPILKPNLLVLYALVRFSQLKVYSRALTEH